MMHRITPLLLALAVATACSTASATDRVLVERLPDGGIQAQAVADAAGATHIAYYKGNASAGDLYYVRRGIDGHYSPPLRINSQMASAIATGSVRGAQIALGRGNRVHVLWNGSDRAEPKASGGMPLLYTRLNDAGTAFEPQRNLASWAGPLDGGGAIAADSEGRVYVTWHAGPGGKTDADRTVYMTRSIDDGHTFSRDRQIGDQRLGACACCSMRALSARDGGLYILYRAAGRGSDRDTMLLTSRDRGETFVTTRLHRWKLEACPLSSAALVESSRGITAAWQTEAQIFFATIGADGAPMALQAAPGSSHRAHPALAANAAGEVILTWLENTAWARGGSLAWQVYGRDGHASPEHGSAPGIPVWGLAAAVALPDGRFLVLY